LLNDYDVEMNLPKRLNHIQLGLEREISDEDEEEEEDENQYEYVYETDEIEEIDENEGQNPVIVEEDVEGAEFAMEFEDGLLPHERAHAS
jgi:hypothetical protein